MRKDSYDFLLKICEKNRARYVTLHEQSFVITCLNLFIRFLDFECVIYIHNTQAIKVIKIFSLLI